MYPRRTQSGNDEFVANKNLSTGHSSFITTKRKHFIRELPIVTHQKPKFYFRKMDEVLQSSDMKIFAI